jgi:hypothetical protein
MHFNFPHSVPGKLKFICPINVYTGKTQSIHQIIKSSNDNGLLRAEISHHLFMDDEPG